MVARKLGQPAHRLLRCPASAADYSSRRGRPRPGRFALVGVAALALALGADSQSPASAQPDAERELEKVRAEIEAVNEELDSQLSSRDTNVAALEQIEHDLGHTARKLNDLNERSAALEARRGELAARMRTAGRRIAAEREALAEQVRMSYMTGRRELVKLLLSQTSPATLGRMLVYYDYMNRARSARIDTVAAELESLERLAAESEEVESRLQRLRADTEAERARLKRQRGERAAVLERLDAAIASAGRRLESLEREERRLADLVERLGEVAGEFPVDVDEPFAELEGHLAWPVPGRLASDFGEPRNGGPLRWKGVVLESPPGTPVRAIYNGRVAFSDWLPGLGLLVIVDHGGGYMSLYGHNEALFREAGDWVAAGEALAQVGDTGGQPTPSLYFEIRSGGEPVDPHEWINGAPSAP